MRLTLTLRKGISKKRILRQIWMSRGTYQDAPLRPPNALIERGVKIIDPLEEKPTPEWRPPVKDPRYAIQYPDPPEAHPLYKEEKAYMLLSSTKFTEGLEQLSLLTKSICHIGLPSEVKELIGRVKIPDQDLLVQRYILQSQKWDTQNVRKPKRIDKSKPGYKFRVEYGISKSHSANLLLQNMVRLCQTMSAQFPSLITDRKLVFNPFLHSHYYYKGKCVYISYDHNILLSGKRPLSPLSDQAQVEETRDSPLPDLYPIDPLIDFATSNIYRLGSDTVWKPEQKEYFPHMIFKSYGDHYRPKQRICRTAMQTFAYALTLARNKYGDNVETLPEPIRINCVHMDEKTMGFIVFQLNTLNYDTDSGVRNFFWLDSNNQIFDKELPRPWLGDEYKTTKYKNYNPEVFEKLLAFYLYDVPEVQDSLLQDSQGKSLKQESVRV